MLRPTLGGLVAVAAIVAVAGVLHDDFTRAAQALVLVVPVVVTAIAAGRVPAYVVAAGASVGLALLSPPVFSVRVHLLDDVVALLVFLGVAFVVGTLVSHRLELLGRVEQQRAALLRSVSHDLRTPLAAIEAAATDLASTDDHGDASRTELLRLISDESRRLDRLVGNLLSLSRIEAGALRPQRQEVDVVELVRSATDRLGRLFTTVPLVADVPEDLPIVVGDWALLEQVVANLLENAVRHSPAGEAVRVAASSSGEHVVVEVDDAGPGIAAADRERVFEPFRSGANAGAQGIGLAICRAVVDAHGGTIRVGDGPRGGARFTVTLPAG